MFSPRSGVGSWPGAAARPAAEVVVGELAGALAHIVELPARGVGADPLGR
ncbi:methionine synthase, partial [Mycobacterium interjectum]|nr:methionine synthase [Mycobacterium interjectum]